MKKQDKNLMVFVIMMIIVAVVNGLISVDVDISQFGPFITIAIPIAYTFWIQQQNIEDDSQRG